MMAEAHSFFGALDFGDNGASTRDSTLYQQRFISYVTEFNTTQDVARNSSDRWVVCAFHLSP